MEAYLLGVVLKGNFCVISRPQERVFVEKVGGGVDQLFHSVVGSQGHPAAARAVAQTPLRVSLSIRHKR